MALLSMRDVTVFNEVHKLLDLGLTGSPGQKLLVCFRKLLMKLQNSFYELSMWGTRGAKKAGLS